MSNILTEMEKQFMKEEKGKPKEEDVQSEFSLLYFEENLENPAIKPNIPAYED